MCKACPRCSRFPSPGVAVVTNPHVPVFAELWPCKLERVQPCSKLSLNFQAAAAASFP